MNPLPEGLSYAPEPEGPMIRHDASGLLVMSLPFDDARWCEVLGPVLAGPDWTVSRDDIDHAVCGERYREARDVMWLLNRRWLDERDERARNACIERNRCDRCGGSCVPYADDCPARGFGEPIPVDELEAALGLDPMPFPWSMRAAAEVPA